MASINNSQDNVQVVGVNVSWSQQQTECVTFVADSSLSLQSTYFENDTHYVWFNGDAAGVDPSVAGKTGIEVAYSSGASAAALVQLAITAMETEGSYSVGAALDANQVKSNLIIQQKAFGPLTAWADGAAATSFTFAVERAGADLPLGFLEGSVEPGLSEDLLDITTLQTGTQIINRLRTGRNVENIPVTLLERDAAKLKEIIEAGGYAVTPSGGTELSGWGSEDPKNFTSVLNESRQLILHPSNKAASDRSEDFCFWRAYPNLNSIVFSGDAAATTTVEFSILPDGLVDEQLRLFVFGDYLQDVLSN